MRYLSKKPPEIRQPVSVLRRTMSMRIATADDLEWTMTGHAYRDHAEDVVVESGSRLPPPAQAIQTLLSLLSHLEDAQPPTGLVNRTMDFVERAQPGDVAARSDELL
jgi:hypothetical protein